MLFAAAGRMNARGISVFYAASHADAAIAEVRPPVGSRVCVARFELIRPLRLLDLTALGTATEQGSIFDADFAPRIERAIFLRSLSQRMTRPVMPDDEAFEYLVTQAIADFLATENEPVLDGIAFPSVQAAGNALNVVLFHKAARVEPIKNPPGLESEVSTGLGDEEGWVDSYAVYESVLPPKAGSHRVEPASGSVGISALSKLRYHESDYREATLRIDLESITVNHIQRVDVDFKQHTVRRNRTVRAPSRTLPPTPAGLEGIL